MSFEGERRSLRSLERMILPPGREWRQSSYPRTESSPGSFVPSFIPNKLSPPRPAGRRPPQPHQQRRESCLGYRDRAFQPSLAPLRPSLTTPRSCSNKHTYSLPLNQRRRYAMRYSGYTNVGWNTIIWHTKAQCATMVIKRSLNGHETV